MNKFDISKYKVIFTLPERIEEPFSWIDHIPFAFFLIDILRPGLFVELGVYSGNSYNAFCQAVKTVKGDTKCYGIDNWLGDRHTENYDGSIYKDLLAYQQDKYKYFSYLLRMTFDEGLNYFSDNTIDLLHIDGFHTYKAVKHDFDSWLPKMSDKGVIVLHDTCVRENDFGVWKLWKEISGEYPSYEFTYGHGLGIVAVGKNINNEFLVFLDSAGKNNYYQIIFAYLGNKIALLNRVAERDGLIVSLGQTVESLIIDRDSQKSGIEQLQASFDGLSRERDEQVALLNRMITERDGLISSLEQTVESLIIDRDSQKSGLEKLQASFDGLSRERDDLIASLEQTVESLIIDRDSQKSGIEQLQASFVSLSRERNEQIALLNRVVAERDGLQMGVEERDGKIENLMTELATVYKSKSWRLTSPLRRLIRKARSIFSRAPHGHKTQCL
ncbi:MAG: class I SAM-dependent methyltransferase [Desulfuromonadales bacterium]|nr:class I SAM-dependent methyltransferase [Desulfuromonadales bacterium]